MHQKLPTKHFLFLCIWLTWWPFKAHFGLNEVPLESLKPMLQCYILRLYIKYSSNLKVTRVWMQQLEYFLVKISHFLFSWVWATHSNSSTHSPSYHRVFFFFFKIYNFLCCFLTMSHLHQFNIIWPCFAQRQGKVFFGN